MKPRTTPMVAGVLALVALAAFVTPAAAAGPWTWNVTASSNTSAAQSNHLFGVACPAIDDCWAVGTYYNGSVDQTLIEAYDGASWRIVSSPNPGPQNTALYGVSCVSIAACWAVGVTYTSVGIGQTLIEQYAGGSWSIVTSANPGATSNALESVACVSASSCWAVGFYSTSQATLTLVEQYDGTSWAPDVSSNVNGSTNDYLQSVTCVSGNDCWAVGGYHDTSSTSRSLIQSYNGTAWNIVGSPDPSSTQNNLQGVACVSSLDCWAVGEESNGSTTTGVGTTYSYVSLINHYDGSSWSTVGSPNAHDSTGAAVSTFLNDVACISATACWAVGEAGIQDQNVIAAYDGTSWSVVTSPHAAATVSDVLNGVACPSATTCWSVGWSTPLQGSDQTFVVGGVAGPEPSVPETPSVVPLLVIALVMSSAWARRRVRPRTRPGRWGRPGNAQRQ